VRKIAIKTMPFGTAECAKNAECHRGVRFVTASSAFSAVQETHSPSRAKVIGWKTCHIGEQHSQPFDTPLVFNLVLCARAVWPEGRAGRLNSATQ
jgi:hypothetical protein